LARFPMARAASITFIHADIFSQCVSVEKLRENENIYNFLRLAA